MKNNIGILRNCPAVHLCISTNVLMHNGVVIENKTACLVQWYMGRKCVGVSF